MNSHKLSNSETIVLKLMHKFRQCKFKQPMILYRDSTIAIFFFGSFGDRWISLLEDENCEKKNKRRSFEKYWWNLMQRFSFINWKENINISHMHEIYCFIVFHEERSSETNISAKHKLRLRVFLFYVHAHKWYSILKLYEIE